MEIRVRAKTTAWRQTMEIDIKHVPDKVKVSSLKTGEVFRASQNGFTFMVVENSMGGRQVVCLDTGNLHNDCHEHEEAYKLQNLKLTGNL